MEKRDTILQAGLAVLYLRGYNGTGVKDIVDEAGIPKGSFYNYFKSKEDFAIEALQRVAAEGLRMAEIMLIHGDGPPLHRLEAFFQHGLRDAQNEDFRRGCLMGNLCQELSGVNDRVRRTISRLFRSLTAVFARCLAEAQVKGELPPDRDVDQLADFVFNAWEGALLRMKCEKSAQPLDDFLQTLPHLLRR